MSQVLKERLKNLITFILIVTGIIQVGILFGYQNEGTPTNLFFGLFNRMQPISDTEARGKMFIPDRLILSNGEKSYWIIDGHNESYKKLWDEVKEDLSDVANGHINLRSSNVKWGELIEKKGILVDFGYVMKPDLLNWFLGNQASGNDLPEFQKVFIKPDIVDTSTGLVYIYGQDGKVYVSGSVIFETVDFGKIYVAAENSGGRVYNSFRGTNIDESLKSPPDVLYVNSGDKYWPYSNYVSTIPGWAENKDELATALLGNDKGRYSSSISMDNMIQFSENNNIYMRYSDGCLTYKYLGTARSAEKGSVGAALLNAYKFIARVNQLSHSSTNLKLSNIKEIEMRPGVYDISFDYSLDDMPVKIDTGTKAPDVGKIKHAITIQADASRVLKCVWLLREFTKAGNYKYNDRFTDLMALTNHGFDELRINDLHSGYFIGSTSDDILKPNLLIDLYDKSTLQVEMPTE